MCLYSIFGMEFLNVILNCRKHKHLTDTVLLLDRIVGNFQCKCQSFVFGFEASFSLVNTRIKKPLGQDFTTL